jgi:hypothetical protein
MTEPASKRGIAHFGVGNFHRAYQAFYIDRCLALPGQNDWGIVGIGLPGGERGREEGRPVPVPGLSYSLTVAASAHEINEAAQADLDLRIRHPRPPTDALSNGMDVLT